MPLGTFIAGRYSSTLNSLDLGIAESGYEVQYEPKEALINRSDMFGDSLIDTIQRGSDWFCQLDSLEYKAGTIAAIAQLTGGTLGTFPTVGKLGSDIAQAFVMTSTAGTPAASTPATLTATKCKLAHNANVRLIFDSLLRKVPIRFQFMPYDSGAGVIKYFVQT